MRYPTCPHCGDPVPRRTLFFVDLDRARPCPSCHGLIIRAKARDWMVVVALVVPIAAMPYVIFTLNVSLAWYVMGLGAAAVAWVGVWVLASPYFQIVRSHHLICLRCGYDLRGLPEPVTCPECGRSPSPTA